MTPEEITCATEEAVQEIRSAQSEPQLEDARIKYLGRKGLLPQMMKGLKALPPEQRADAGRNANIFKQKVHQLLDKRACDLKGGGEKSVAGFDRTLPGRWRGTGTMHPISRVIEEAVRILGGLGFTVAEGPDVETGYRNFDALNTPGHHPSRGPLDTFWLENGDLLRTQTSPVQIRVMEKQPPPVRIITPGRCYRRDTTDATHSASFFQIEGLYVDRDVSLADLKGVLEYFAQSMMGEETAVRFRPHFFPFTEPSVECDFSCHVCAGRGCRVCKHSGWIEIAGAGMVDPRVFDQVGYDSEVYTGYAFGMGIERIAMVKYGINDIRLLYENDTRFLSQFT